MFSQKQEQQGFVFHPVESGYLMEGAAREQEGQGIFQGLEEEEKYEEENGEDEGEDKDRNDNTRKITFVNKATQTVEKVNVENQEDKIRGKTATNESLCKRGLYNSLSALVDPARNILVDYHESASLPLALEG